MHAVAEAGRRGQLRVRLLCLRSRLSAWRSCSAPTKPSKQRSKSVCRTAPSSSPCAPLSRAAWAMLPPHARRLRAFDGDEAKVLEKLRDWKDPDTENENGRRPLHQAQCRATSSVLSERNQFCLPVRLSPEAT